ncbi:MAG: glycosyltransferase [Bacteroides sp.]|nr:glycosyltransferase [Bacteroides sp.]
MKRRIKVFLGGYVNFLNAQNINCRALSEHLDKDRFEVTTMLHWHQNAKDFKHVPRVKYIQLRRPSKLWSRLCYLRGITWADVAYLPKGEIDTFCKRVANLFGTKIFTTVEGMIDELNISLCRMNGPQRDNFINHFRLYEPNLYAITKYIAGKVGESRGYNFQSNVLYLGVDSEKFTCPDKKLDGLKNVVFIGSTPSIKNVYDLFEAAALNPDIRFHVVGGNEIKEGTIENYIAEHALTNVTYHGRLDHTRLAELLRGMDLMYFPSRSEGFPKVHLETASAGVPTLCYGDYGAREWITTWRDGIVVDTKEEAFDALSRLKMCPELLQSLSRNAVMLGQRFDWENLIADWESEIERIYNS